METCEQLSPSDVSLSPFQYFVRSSVDAHNRTYPGLRVAETDGPIVQKCKEFWETAISASEKQRYVEMSNVFARMRNAEEPPLREVTGGGIKKEVKQEMESPKVSRLAAYNHFANKMRSQVQQANPGFTTRGEVQKEIGRLWKNLSEQEQCKYQEMAAAVKEKVHGDPGFHLEDVRETLSEAMGPTTSGKAFS